MNAGFSWKIIIIGSLSGRASACSFSRTIIRDRGRGASGVALSARAPAGEAHSGYEWDSLRCYCGPSQRVAHLWKVVLNTPVEFSPESPAENSPVIAVGNSFFIFKCRI
jgi:hypothetical protein